MIQSPTRVSIIIPVYNEEDHIADCLEAIAHQTIAPYEVIVVDNNSTDATATIVRRYSFTKLITAKRQGVVHARNRGFNAAKGEILGRIDADTKLPPDWTAQVAAIFNEDSTVDAISGAVTYHDFPFSRLTSQVDLLFRRSIAFGMADEVFLYGANMAIRREAWLETRNHVCYERGLHEDFDLAIHTTENGSIVRFDSRLIASVSLRRIDVAVRDFWEYVLQSPRTYARHGLKSQRHMYPALIAALFGYWFIRVLHRSYDEQTGRFSWHKLWRDTADRINPANFVD